MVNSFVARPVTVSAKSPITYPNLYHELSVGGTMEVLDLSHHQHTTNRWGPVVSMDLTYMTAECHAHYQLAQVSDFKAAVMSSPTLQANVLEGESKAVIVIPSSPGLGYSNTDHALAASDICIPADATLNTTAHIATCGIVQDRESACNTCANARMCCHLLSTRWKTLSSV